jgi:hypothetical protein
VCVLYFCSSILSADAHVDPEPGKEIFNPTSMDPVYSIMMLGWCICDFWSMTFVFFKLVVIRSSRARLKFSFPPTDLHSYVPCVPYLLAAYSFYRRVWGSGVGQGNFEFRLPDRVHMLCLPYVCVFVIRELQSSFFLLIVIRFSRAKLEISFLSHGSAFLCSVCMVSFG